MALWLYLHFPQLQLDSLYHHDVEQQPTIIVTGRGHSVVQLNTEAHKAGIRAGMGLGAAAATCSSLCVHEYDEAQTKQRLVELAQWLYLNTAEIHLSGSCGLLLKVSGMLAMYRDVTEYWQTLQARLHAQNVHFHFSLGYSPLAAQLLAEAKLDIVCEDTKRLDYHLGRLPISALALPNKQLQGLMRVGVKSVRALFAIPMLELGKRFDTELVHYVGRLRGKLHHPVTFYQPPEVFERQLTLLYELENLDWVAKPLLKLLIQLEQFLKLRNKLTKSIKFTLLQRDCEALHLEIGSAEGEYRADKWQGLCLLVLERTQLAAPLQSIALSVTEFCEPDEISSDLFSERCGTMTAAGLLAVLQAKLGVQAVQGIEPRSDARPELATSLCAPLTSKTNSASQLKLEPMLRPNLLLPQILPLQQPVTLIQGPERICTGWWDGHEIERDYFIAQDESKRWLWVFRDRQQRWYLHGVFS
ncbi:Y-family DNA polymerase [Pseudoalteromonas luteoviolacea]|uniref:Y-family DNA polymerase n=1 Tax=Pseudoalteromonas luteoviolacea TaxID=43657 RepID=UPI001150657C|nr:DNA polymerase Y family protein [Pseudoalteromonas luteoviolacea]TQF71762.1 DNA polymerase Y family protein [Pseudoalteromonas luteoviolacea]